uniref:LITAF domain-containing protein n=1 Tax=Panagrolaimus sp. JU765 TaxID=591449 RepID=A0AC34QKZ2_9BILA
MRNYQQDYQNQSFNNQGGFVPMNSSPGRYDPKYTPPHPQQSYEYAPQYATDVEDQRQADKRKTWVMAGGCLLCLLILIIIGIICAIVLPRVGGPEQVCQVCPSVCEAIIDIFYLQDPDDWKVFPF